jgi:hypothetical protein
VFDKEAISSQRAQIRVGGRLLLGRFDVKEGIMTTLLFTIAISADYRGAQEIYSAQVIARNGLKLYHLAEALSISEALEKVVQEMRLEEKNSASFR